MNRLYRICWADEITYVEAESLADALNIVAKELFIDLEENPEPDEVCVLQDSPVFRKKES